MIGMKMKRREFEAVLMIMKPETENPLQKISDPVHAGPNHLSSWGENSLDARCNQTSRRFQVTVM